MKQIAGKENLNLRKRLDFDEKDLSLNRQLKLSERQKQKLKKVIDFNLSASIFCTMILFFVAVTVFFIGSKSFLLFVLSLSGGIGFGLSFYWAFLSLQWQKQLRKYAGVKFVEGIGSFKVKDLGSILSEESDGTMALYSMQVGDLKFYLDEKTYDSIQGNEFRIYYFQTLRKQILSIENID